MPLAELMGVPNTPAEQQSWAFANAASHRDIIRRVQETKGVLLEEHPLWFNPDDAAGFNDFLNAHQDMHNDFAVALGLASYNLSELDWSDEDARAQWVMAHAQMHIAASALLGVS